MKNEESDSGYEIGYGKPPRKNRFQTGVSGNPEGRPKGAQAFGLYLEKALNKRMTISTNGKEERLTMMQIITRRIKTGAMKGGPKDARVFLDLLERFDEEGFRPITRIIVIEDEEEEDRDA